MKYDEEKLDAIFDSIVLRVSNLEKAAEPRDAFVACLHALQGVSAADRARMLFALMAFFGIEELEGVAGSGEAVS